MIGPVLADEGLAMELRQLKYVVSLSETGNFARAAAREHITQSALSQQVARLERELGVLLFERTPRGSVLTKAGQEILVLARGILTQVAQLESYARSIGRGMTGELHIGSPMYAVSNAARYAVVQEFQERAPGVGLLFENDWSATLSRRLQSGQLDLAFTMIGEHDPDLEKLLVDESPACVVVPEDDELAQVQHVQAGHLAGRRVLVYPRSLSAWVYERLADRLREVGAQPVELREPALPAAMAQVQQGDGIFLAVPWEVPLVHADLMRGLVTRPTGPALMLTYTLWLARRESDRSSLSGAFWEVAREVAERAGDLPSAG